MIKKIDHDKAMDRKINELIASSVVLVACPEDDPELIVGYAIFSFETLHYIYIKQAFRKMGFAHELFKSCTMPENSITITHINKPALDIIEHLNLKFEFNPFKAQF